MPVTLFEYECPHCAAELYGRFSENVYCKICNITLETEWDYISEDSVAAWLTGKELPNDET